MQGNTMTSAQCADILHSFIRHRENMHKKETICIDSNGLEVSRGYINPEKDVLYQAMKFALQCVEEKVEK